ncbi:SLC32A [Lepeophtheirus salmonis]|uniref:SLC32A n=1 Tax=Lepeophtheirus salmonis TaxID=72036 RepID=A0A7R8D5S8_LEPSM|nr:SLC32A [Lepeophtheirus salmonis]CAF3038092.1 SLC32A [Lepeophtheirus salmonis]
MSETVSIISNDSPFQGLGFVFAAFIIVSETAGSGILALPQAMVATGYWGLPLISYEIILEEGSTASHRDPYPVIAEVSGSTIGRKSKSIFRQMTIVSMVVMNYGSGVVFLLLQQHAIACILIIIRLILDYKEGYHPKNNCPTSKDNEFSFQSLLGIIESYSTVMFAFAGASVYPSIQDDMRNKSHFKYTAILSIVLIICMYVPVSWLGYALIGDCVNRNVILSLKPGIIKSSVEILLILHLYTAITIFLNPIHQYFEFLFHINLEFNWKRIAFRSSIMALMIFVGLSIPEFSNLLDFIGSGPSALINFILPPCFYLLLVRSTSGLRSLPILERILCVFIASSGLILACFFWCHYLSEKYYLLAFYTTLLLEIDKKSNLISTMR